VIEGGSAFDHLFPDSFEDSELGEIPKGWTVVTLEALAVVRSGKRPPAVFPERGERAPFPLWGGNGPMGFVRDPLLPGPILLTGRVGTLGAVFRVRTPCWPSDNTLVILARVDEAYEFLYFQLLSADLGLLNRGSTQPLLAQADLKAQQFVLPQGLVLGLFHKVVSSLFLRSNSLVEASGLLAAVRDALLPRLISGALRVPHAVAWGQRRAEP